MERKRRILLPCCWLVGCFKLTSDSMVLRLYAPRDCDGARPIDSKMRPTRPSWTASNPRVTQIVRKKVFRSKENIESYKKIRIQIHYIMNQLKMSTFFKSADFLGATASTRGASGHSAFSSAKMAKRALAQVKFRIQCFFLVP